MEKKYSVALNLNDEQKVKLKVMAVKSKMKIGEFVTQLVLKCFDEPESTQEAGETAEIGQETQV